MWLVNGHPFVHVVAADSVVTSSVEIELSKFKDGVSVLALLHNSSGRCVCVYVTFTCLACTQAC
jgi:hypothetical protein